MNDHSEEPAIEARGLTRYFDTHCVVDRMDFSVPRGKVTALLGLNGAGKTTTIRMIMGLLDPTRGECETLGVDSRELTPEVMRRIGYLVEGHYLSPWMRVSQMESFAQVGQDAWDHERYEALVEHFRISKRQRVGKLSRGQRAGVSLACVMAADPELLVLDDPALGLDPVSRRALNEALVEFASGQTRSGAQRTVLLSTHLLDDVERIADEIAVMISGRLLVQTTLADFTDRVRRWSIANDSVPDVAELRKRIPGLVEARQLGDRVVACVADPDASVTDQLAQSIKGQIESLPTSLQDLVIAYLSTEGSETFHHSRVEASR